MKCISFLIWVYFSIDIENCIFVHIYISSKSNESLFQGFGESSCTFSGGDLKVYKVVANSIHHGTYRDVEPLILSEITSLRVPLTGCEAQLGLV